MKKPPKRFEVVRGGWIRPVMKDYFMCCCDCGLVHRLTFRVVDNRVIFKAFRHEGATRDQRKRKRILVRKEYRKDYEAKG